MRIRQIVFAAQHLADSRALLARLLPMAAPFRDPGVAEFGIDNAVFSLGDQFIEVISPTRPDSACSRHLARLGDSGYMLILQTDDLARDQARFQQLGVRSIWQAEFDDIRAMHLHPKDVGAAIVSVDQPLPPQSWRWGGPDWLAGAAPWPALPAAQRPAVRGITLRAQQPEAMARRWAQVFDRPAPAPATVQGPNGGTWRVPLDEGFADFVSPPASAPAAPDGIAGFTLALADPALALSAAQAAGLAVDGHGFQLLGARIDLLAA